jgi:excisionase family DNA binding protein
MKKQVTDIVSNNTSMRKEEPEVVHIMTVQEVADYLRLSKDSVYKLVKIGELPAAMILNKLRFDRTSVEEYFKQREVNNK